MESSNDRVAVSFSWSDAEGKRQEWAHLLQLREGAIIDMQDYASRRDAERALRRH